MTHVSDGESTKRWVIGKGLNAHWLGRDHLYDGLWRRTGVYQQGLGGFGGPSALVRHDRGKLTASPDLTNLRAERHVSTDKEDGRHVCGLLGEVLNGFTSSSVDLLEDGVADEIAISFLRNKRPL